MTGREGDSANVRKQELTRDRKRRHRKREKANELVLHVVVPDDFINFCLEQGLADERRVWDRAVLGSIARRIIETAMGRDATSVTRPSVNAPTTSRP